MQHQLARQLCAGAHDIVPRRGCLGRLGFDSGDSAAGSKLPATEPQRQLGGAQLPDGLRTA